MSGAAIEVAGLTKAFGGLAAVDRLDMVVPAGTVYGVLGPNGAGKTTTIRMLATLLRPDAGTAAVFGHDVLRDADAVRARIGLTGQFATVDDDLTGTENLVLLGRLRGLGRRGAAGRAAELVDAFDLADAAGRPVRTYSGGMRRRLDLAASIVVRPDLLFLDEPTTGLDPRSRNQIWELIRSLAASGTTVLLTTQYLDEADRLADRVVVIDHGRVLAEGTPGALKHSTGTGVLRVRLADPAQAARAARLLDGMLGVAAAAGADPAELSARLGAGAGAPEVARAVADLSAAGIDLTGFALGQPSLDEVFLTLTDKTLTDKTVTERED